MKGKYSKYIIMFMILATVAFTAATLCIFKAVGNEPTALIAAWFGFATAEITAAATIKIKKIKEKKDNE